MRVRCSYPARQLKKRHTVSARSGYLIVPNFLSETEVESLNDAFDAMWDQRRIGAQASKRSGYDQFYGMLEVSELLVMPLLAV